MIALPTMIGTSTAGRRYSQRQADVCFADGVIRQLRVKWVLLLYVPELARGIEEQGVAMEQMGNAPVVSTSMLKDSAA